ncbi:hypothetical protein LOZ41_006703 [Ophidiomyces ophidiicola]|nr:hypothetical protein LOZ41_006703 [Ophidiomyces ophidiicola]
MSYAQLPHCGCWFIRQDPSIDVQKVHLPQVDLKIHATLLGTTSRTVLSQTFENSEPTVIENAAYTFPLFDGVSVVSFQCDFAGRSIHGLVKERDEARTEYDAAVEKGESAGLLEQSTAAGDTFTTSIGNIPPKSTVVVHITYIGELQHDAQANGVRFTIPTSICPRYGGGSKDVPDLGNVPDTVSELLRTERKAHVPSSQGSRRTGAIDITVDVMVADSSVIQRLHSPSHPIDVLLGRISTDSEDDHRASRASATKALRSQGKGIALEKDFVLIVNAKDQHLPYAFLETHPTLPHQKALMTSIVPRFELPPSAPEIVFIIDRSGSMYDKIATLKTALKVFLKSLPVGIKFNICSFGSEFSFLWKKSKSYDKASLDAALAFTDTIDSDFGGTEMLAPFKATVENRFPDLDLEVLVLTDGEIWEQEELFAYINKIVPNNPIRFFSLGIGDTFSHSLIQGIARAGNGFSQSVTENEELDKKVVRMLKGALTPHIDYTLEVEYETDVGSTAEDDDFEIVEEPSSDQSKTMNIEKEESQAKTISLFDETIPETDTKTPVPLPTIPEPAIIQAPYKLPSLFPFNRTTVYLLFSPMVKEKKPKFVLLKGSSKHGPLSLKIPVEHTGEGTTIHQLTARKITAELEEGRGWIFNAKNEKGVLFIDEHQSKKNDFAKREAVRLGVKYQIVGKWCSFVAVDSSQHELVNLAGKYAHIGKMEGQHSGVLMFRSGAPITQRGASVAGRGGPVPRCRRGGGGPMAYSRGQVNLGGGARGSESASFTAMSLDFNDQEELVAFAPASEAAAVSRPNVESKERTFHQLILSQTFEGSWEWDNEVFQILGVDAGFLEDGIDWANVLGIEPGDVNKADNNLRRIIVTLAAVSFLNTKCQENKDTWELVTAKALGWANGMVSKLGGRSALSEQHVAGLFQWKK